jgi:hypothetical protein
MRRPEDPPGPNYDPEFLEFLREMVNDEEFLEFLTWDLDGRP